MTKDDAIIIMKDIRAEMENARDSIAVEAIDIILKEVERLGESNGKTD